MAEIAADARMAERFIDDLEGGPGISEDSASMVEIVEQEVTDDKIGGTGSHLVIRHTWPAQSLVFMPPDPFGCVAVVARTNTRSGSRMVSMSIPCARIDEFITRLQAARADAGAGESGT